MGPKKKKAKDIIPKEKYRKILKGLKLENIYFMKGRFSLEKEELKPGSKVTIAEKASFEIKANNSVYIIHAYKLNVINIENKKRSVNIECSFHLKFLSEEEFPENFFEIFKKVNLPVHTWPFFREYVFNITAKMNIPPLTLPLLKRNI